MSGKNCTFPCRYIVALLGFCSFFVLGSQRMNISIAIVSMVNRTSSKMLWNSSQNSFSDECLPDPNVTEDIKKGHAEFNWSPELENYVLAAGFAGFMLSLIPGGLLADTWSAKSVLTLGILLSSVCNLASPVGCRWSVYCLIALQFVKGLGQGVIQPSLGCLMASWFPKEELSSLAGVIYAGGRAGNFVAGMVSGILCELEFLGGWPLVFYVFGIIGGICCVLLHFFLYETPVHHPSIDASELAYISRNSKAANASKRPPTPWLAILSSASTWALFASMFGLYWYPMYFASVHSVFLGSILHFPMSQIGIMTSTPYIIQALVTMASGSLSDWLFRKNYASLNFIRKTNNIVSCVIISLSLTGACFVGCNKWMSVVFFTLAMGGSGFTNAGCYVVPVDMTPNFAGTLTGLGTTAGFLSATTIPLLTGRFLREEHTMAQWKKVFLVSIFVTMISGIAFLLFGSAEIQPWNNPRTIMNREKSEDIETVLPRNHIFQDESEDRKNKDVIFKTHM